MITEKLIITEPKVIEPWAIKQHELIQAYINENISCVCCKGCAECCKQAIAVTKPELNLILKRMKSMPETQNAEIISKLSEQMKIIRSHNMEKVPDNKFANSATLENIHRIYQLNYYKLNLPCVFLTKDCECSIYDIRPMSCITYVQVEDREYCKESVNAKGIIKFDTISREYCNRFVEAGEHVPNRVIDILPIAISHRLNI